MSRARQITRDNLVTRLANLRGTTFGESWDDSKHMDTATLRGYVETLEREDAPVGRHASFRRGGSEQWTGGLTR